MHINHKGYWEDEGRHGVDPQLAIAIADFFISKNAHSVIDLGCGNGYYTNIINTSGVPCLGIDGNPMTKYLAGEDFLIADLTQPYLFGNFDWALSLEVGEHIPEEFMYIFINNIHNNCTKGAIVSWAIPGQGGDGHVNCKPNQEIKSIFKDMGYENDLQAEIFLRNKVAIYPKTGYWFRDTLMVFTK